MSDVFDELGLALQRLATRSARQVATPVERFRVTRTSPLTVVSERDDALVLEDGDEDFVIAKAVADATLAVGDLLLVHAEHDGDFLATGVVNA